MKIGVESADPKIRLCRRHGLLVISAWYLLQQERIWNYEIYRGLSLDERVILNQFSCTAEAIHRFLFKYDAVKAARRKMDVCSFFVQQWTATLERQIEDIRDSERSRKKSSSSSSSSSSSFEGIMVDDDDDE